MVLGTGRPIQTESGLESIGDLPRGGILAQVGNSCGTCSLSAVMRFFGTEITPEEIDREIRRFNIYTSPDLLVWYARRKGYASAFLNHTSREELMYYLDIGVPVILLVDTRPGEPYNPFHFHYVVALSYREAGDGFRLGIYNPWGLREEITGDELDGIWRQLKIGAFTCWDAASIPVGPSGVFKPKGRRRGAVGINMIALSGSLAVNGSAHLLSDGKLLKGLFEFFLSVLLLPAGVLVFAFERVARIVQTGLRSFSKTR